MKEEKYKLSVIVPVYNVEKYLKRCVDSILRQNYENMEVLLIDDGSTDKSGEICDAIEKSSEKIKVIHQENKGLSEARNAGVDLSKGDYILFIDSDDFIEDEAVSELMSICNEKQVDVALCHQQDDYGNTARTVTKNTETFYCTGKEALGLMLEGVKIPGTACAKIVKKEITDGLRFPAGKTYEDAFFNTDLFLRADTVYCTTAPYYHYWHRKGSITTASFSVKNFDVIDAYTLNLQKVRALAPELESLALFRYYWSYCVVLDKMLMTDNFKTLDRYDEIKSFIKKNWLNIVRCKYLSKFRRMSIIIFILNVQLYRQIVIFKTNREGLNF